jgi:hypothetical protein
MKNINIIRTAAAAALCAAFLLLGGCGQSIGGSSKLKPTVTIEGSFSVGGRLAARVESPAEEELPEDMFTYQWHRGREGSEGIQWEEIPGADRSAYTLTPDDEGCYIKVSVSSQVYGLIEPSIEQTEARKVEPSGGTGGGDGDGSGAGGGTGAGDGTGQRTISHKNFLINAVMGLPAADPEVNAEGKVVASLTMHTAEGPWTPELAEGLDDNHLFEIVQTGADVYDIKIKDGPLTVAPYTVSVNISNAAGDTFHRIIKFSVSLTPPPFTKAPSVYPYITKFLKEGENFTGRTKNRLDVSWDEQPRTAKGYQLYVGTSENSADAKPWGGQLEPSARQADITDIDDDETEDGLPDGTTYYVWIKPYNDEGEGAFGPAAKVKTSDPIDPYWWTEIDWWDSGTDSYEFYFNESNELVMGYCTKGSQVGGVISDNGRWIVRYHESYDTVKLNEYLPNTASGHYTTGGEDLTKDKDGNPAGSGVFVVETNREGKPFYANYYWGHKTVYNGTTPKTNPFTQPVSLQGSVKTYVSMAWNSQSTAIPSGGGYRATLAEAIAFYNFTNFKYLVAFVAIPFYPVYEDRYKFGTPVN